LNSHSHHGIFLVSETSVPVLDSQALANDIVARIEREFALADHSRTRGAYLPTAFFVPQRETPIVVLRRVIKSFYSFTFNA